MDQTQPKCKTRILWVLALVTITLAGCHGRTDQQQKPTVKTQAAIDTSGAPDEQMIEELARQPQSKPTDTAFKHLTLHVKKININFRLYERFKNFVGSKLKLKKQIREYIDQNQLNINPNQSFSNMDYVLQPGTLNTQVQQNGKLSDLIKILTDSGSYICHLKTFKDRGLPQHKVIYIWGSKSYDKRSKPDSPMTCGYLYHGMDCSGFICRLLRCAGVIIPDPRAIGSADALSKPPFLTKYLPQFFGATKFRVDTLHIGVPQIATGDLVCFKDPKKTKVTHIGIALRDDHGVISLFQCLGSDTPPYCKWNLQDDHGMLSSDITDYLHRRPHYFIVRITQL